MTLIKTDTVQGASDLKTGLDGLVGIGHDLEGNVVDQAVDVFDLVFFFDDFYR